MTDDDKSLGDQHTFDGETPGKPDTPDASLGDEMTYAGGASTGPSSLGDEMTHDGQASAGPSSLGDEVTFSGVAEGLEDDLVDDGMEVVDLEERYTIEGELGKGGMGEVLLATDKRLDRKVAIKRVLGKAARSKKAWQRFENGAKTIAKLNHQNIVRVYEYGLAKDGPFMILECVTGGSLLDRCKQGPIPLEEAIEITCQLCDGIANAHAKGIIHRDIKPANVLMTEEGIPKLNDFDLAKVGTVDLSVTQEGAVLGTLDFMPPEQRQDAKLVDQRSDLWSLAATMYQMVTGKSPKIIKFKDVPPALHDVLGKALEDEKEDRYQSAREFRDALRASMSAPVPAAVEAVTDLGVGQCPECHARNSEESKFCTSCTAALRVDCLNCGESIPVWHPGCGECGGRQSELIQQRKDEVDGRRSEAETLADQYEFDKAVTLANKILAIEDPRWSHQHGWAEQFIAETQQEKERQIESARATYGEAKKHHADYDYESALRVLEGVAQPIRNQVQIPGSGHLEAYYQELVSCRDELNELMPTIRKRVKARDLDGLLEQVNRVLELDPNREKLFPLRDQLLKRQAARAEKYEEIHQQASQQLAEGNAKAALRTVSRIKEDGFPPHLKELKQQLTEMVELENELTTLVKQAKADGNIDMDEVDEILPKTEKYLQLNPNHEVIRKLAQDLRKRSSPIMNPSLAQTLSGHVGKVANVAWSPDGRWLVSIAEDEDLEDHDGDLILWETASWKPVFKTKFYRLAELQFSPNGKWLFLFGSETQIIDLSSGQYTDQFFEDPERTTAISFLCSPNGKWIALNCNYGNRIEVRDALSGQKLVEWSVEDGFHHMAISPDSSKLATANSDGTIQIWGTNNGQRLKIVPGHVGEVQKVAWSPDGRWLASIAEDEDLEDHDGDLILWSTASWKPVFKMKSCKYAELLFSSNGKWLIQCHESVQYEPCIIDLATTCITDVFDDKYASDFQNSPDGTCLAFRRFGSSISIRDATNWKERSQIKIGEEANSFSNFAFSSNSRLIATANQDKTVKIWDLYAGKSPEQANETSPPYIEVEPETITADDDFEIDRGQAETLKEQPDLADLPASIRHKKAAKMLAVSVDRLTEMRNNRDIEGFRDAGKWKYKIEELKRVAADLGLTLDTSALSQGDSENGIDFDGPISKGQDQTQGRMGGLFGGGL